MIEKTSNEVRQDIPQPRYVVLRMVDEDNVYRDCKRSLSALFREDATCLDKDLAEFLSNIIGGSIEKL